MSRREMNGPIKLVIFDLDGTLVDAYQAVAESLNSTLVQFGCAPVDDEKIKRSVGWGDRHLIGTFIAKENIDKALSMFRQHHARALKKGTTFLPGARQLIDELKAKNYLLAIASNRPTRFTHIILKHLKIRDAFDHVLCADKVARPKPAADIIEKILSKFSLSPDEVLYVGDMTVDVETGNRAGVRTVAVLTGSSSRAEVQRLDPFRVIDHVAQVSPIIEDLVNKG